MRDGVATCGCVCMCMYEHCLYTSSRIPRNDGNMHNSTRFQRLRHTCKYLKTTRHFHPLNSFSCLLAFQNSTLIYSLIIYLNYPLMPPNSASRQSIQLVINVSYTCLSFRLPSHSIHKPPLVIQPPHFTNTHTFRILSTHNLFLHSSTSTRLRESVSAMARQGEKK